MIPLGLVMACHGGECRDSSWTCYFNSSSKWISGVVNSRCLVRTRRQVLSALWPTCVMLNATKNPWQLEREPPWTFQCNSSLALYPSCCSDVWYRTQKGTTLEGQGHAAQSPGQPGLPHDHLPSRLLREGKHWEQLRARLLRAPGRRSVLGPGYRLRARHRLRELWLQFRLGFGKHWLWKRLELLLRNRNQLRLQLWVGKYRRRQLELRQLGLR